MTKFRSGSIFADVDDMKGQKAEKTTTEAFSQIMTDAIDAFNTNAVGVQVAINAATTVADLKAIMSAAITDMSDQFDLVKTALEPYLPEEE